MKTLGGRLLTLTGGMLGAGLLLGPIAFGASGYLGVEGLAYSLLLCLIPGLLTLLLAELLKNTDLSAFVVVAGGGLRMLFVLLGVLGMNSLRPDLGLREFTVWLIVCYLVALAIETAVVLAPASRGGAVKDRS